MTQPLQTQDSPLPSAVLYGLVAALIWGAWPVISAVGIRQSLAGSDIAALRFLVAGLVLLPLVIRRGHGGLGWGRALIISLCAGAPYVMTSAGGLAYAPAGQGGIITPSCTLIFTTLGGWLLLGDRPPRQRLIGVAIILAGVALIGAPAFTGETFGGEAGGSQQWKGHLLFVAGGFLWASYTLTSRAWQVDPLQATALVSVLSLALYGPVYLAFAGPRLLEAPLAEIAGQALFQGLFAAILALLCYTRAVAILGAGRGAVFATLVPAIALILAYPLLGEVPGWRELLGGGLVTLGMITALGFLPGRLLSWGRFPASTGGR